MSSYPPPPQPDQQHYNPAYPIGAGAQQPLDQVQQDQFNFANLGQPSPYPKAENEAFDQQAAARLEQQIEQLRQQQSIPPHPQQQEHLTLQQSPQLNGQQQGDTPSKANRLRKACDSCSIRKVKVRHDLRPQTSRECTCHLHSTLIYYSVMSPAHHVKRVPHWIYRAHSSDRAVEEDLRTDMQRRSSADVLNPLTLPATLHRRRPRMLHKLLLPCPHIQLRSHHYHYHYLPSQSVLLKCSNSSSTTTLPTSTRFAPFHTSQAFEKHGGEERTLTTAPS